MAYSVVDEVPASITDLSDTDWFKTVLKTPGITRYHRALGHELSWLNKLIVAQQAIMAGLTPGISATEREFVLAERTVKPDQKGNSFVVRRPKFPYYPELDKNGKPVINPKTGKPKWIKGTTPNGFDWIRSRYVEVQTTGKAIPLPELPFDYGDLFCNLEVEMVDFAMDDMQCGGYCYNDGDGDYLAINTFWENPVSVMFHELGHIVLRHTTEGRITEGEDRTPRDLRELEAEGVALVMLDALDLPGQAECRGYLQNWNIQGYDEIPEKSARRIFAAADIIYQAGRNNPDLKKIRLRKPKAE